MNPDFIKLTSSRDTPLFVRKSAVLVAEGFDFSEGMYANHTGSRLTLRAGQWTETIYCIETSEVVIRMLES
jgi:hypothetical protein